MAKLGQISPPQPIVLVKSRSVKQLKQIERAGLKLQQNTYDDVDL